MNVLPYVLFVKLGLGELKETSITIQLADGTIRIPRVSVEDVLIQIENFYFPADFVVLDILGPQSHEPTPIILGRPFLATCNALVDCRSGLMKITFGNMSLDLNIFHIRPLPLEGGESQNEVNYIGTSIESPNHFDSLLAPTFMEHNLLASIESSTLDSIDALVHDIGETFDCDVWVSLMSEFGC